MWSEQKASTQGYSAGGNRSGLLLVSPNVAREQKDLWLYAITWYRQRGHGTLNVRQA